MSERCGGGLVRENGDPHFLPHLTHSLLTNAFPSVWVRLRNGWEIAGHSSIHIRLTAVLQAGGSCQQLGQSWNLCCSQGNLLAAKLETVLRLWLVLCDPIWAFWWDICYCYFWKKTLLLWSVPQHPGSCNGLFVVTNTSAWAMIRSERQLCSVSNVSCWEHETSVLRALLATGGSPGGVLKYDFDLQSVYSLSTWERGHFSAESVHSCNLC